MTTNRRTRRIHPAWSAIVLMAVIVVFAVVCSALFAGLMQSTVPVTLTSDRSGLVMESGAKVKMRGVEVGRVTGIAGGEDPVVVHLAIDARQVKAIPANVGAQIRATTAFGAKYVDLIYPTDPSAQRLRAGTVLHSLNVSTEVNTVFENLTALLRQIDVAKLNSTLTAIAEGVRGQGERIGEATTAASNVLTSLNPRMPQLQQDWRSFTGFNEAYDGAAEHLLATLDAAATTATTVTDHQADLDALLLGTVGFSDAGINLIAPNADNVVAGINTTRPTTDLLLKYNPEYTCLIVGAKWFLDNGGYENIGGNGRTLVSDSALLAGDQPYVYPDNLPVVAAKGGPGGKPSCGSLPDVSKNFPVRQLITNTGWGTGLDVRPNPGIGHPWLLNLFPVTKGVPEPPRTHGDAAPAPGPIPYPGAPPYGAPLYGPDGTPLWPGVPPAPPPAPPAP